MRLTARERVLLHLLRHLRYRDEYIVPEGLTQEGIGLALGISRAHATVTLAGMINPGLVERRLARVAKKPRRLVSFHLTSEGEREARRILEAAGEENGPVEVEELVLALAKAVKGNELEAVKDRVRGMEEQIATIRKRIESIENAGSERMERPDRL